MGVGKLKISLSSQQFLKPGYNYFSSCASGDVSAYVTFYQPGTNLSHSTVSNKNKLITGILCVLITAQFVIIMIYFAIVYHFTSPLQLITRVNLESAANAVIATTDILIAGFLVWLLAGNRSAFKRTNSILNRLIFYTIASGAVTALCAIATLVTAQVFPDTFIYLTLDLMMAKCKRCPRDIFRDREMSH